MAMNEIASRLGKTRSEIFRMTLTLEKRGYIYKEQGSDQYILTIKLFEMGMNHPPNRSLQEVALPLMNQLSQQSNQACYISVALYEHTVVIANVDAPGHSGFSVKVGHQEHLVNSAGGKVLYAFLSDKLQDEWLQRFKQDEDTSFNANSFVTETTEIRQKGFAQQDSNLIHGVVDMAVPIFSENKDYALASLVVPLVQHVGVDNELEQVRDALISTAQQISDKLCYSALEQA